MNKQNKIYLIVGIIVIAIISLILIFSSNKIKDESYEIGVVTSLSGNGANLGKPWVQGMELAVNEINQNGGINGKNIILLIEDDKLNPTETTTATQFLISTKNPSILTTLFEVSTQAMGPISNNKKIPMLTTSFSRGILSSNPYSYKINFDALNGCEQIIKNAKDNNKYSKLGVLMSRVGYNEDCIKGVKKVESNVVEEWYNFGEKDFRTQLLKLKNNGVDGIITVGIDFEYIAMFDQITELGYNTNFFCATASECIFNEGLEDAADKMLGTVYGIDFFNPNELPNSDFANKYSEKYGKAEGLVLTYSAIGYDQTYMLKEIFEKCAPKDHECINKEMNSYNGSGGKIIKANGFRDRVLNYDYQLYRFENNWILE